MKKALFAILILSILTTLGFMGHSIMNKLELKKKLEKQTPVPEFAFETIGGQSFGKSNLISDVPVMIMYVNPTCDDCYLEIKNLLENINLFEDAQILMVSSNDMKLIKEFATYFDLQNYPQIKILRCDRERFVQDFGSAVPPSVFVYNKHHRLAKYFKGGAKMTLIHKVMHEDI